MPREVGSAPVPSFLFLSGWNEGEAGELGKRSPKDGRAADGAADPLMLTPPHESWNDCSSQSSGYSAWAQSSSQKPKARILSRAGQENARSITRKPGTNYLVPNMTEALTGMIRQEEGKEDKDGERCQWSLFADNLFKYNSEGSPQTNHCNWDVGSVHGAGWRTQNQTHTQTLNPDSTSLGL